MEMKFKFLAPLLIISVLVLSGCASNTGAVTATTQQEEQEAGASDFVSIPVAQISEKAKWFEYNSNGVDVRFFVVKAGDGSIKTAFDACDVCYGNHKGYSQQGTYMVCNNCGNKYPIDGLGTENKGYGCWPSYLPNKVTGDQVLLKKTDLDKGRVKFA